MGAKGGEEKVAVEKITVDDFHCIKGQSHSVNCVLIQRQPGRLSLKKG
jgi:hypothetical protein